PRDRVSGRKRKRACAVRWIVRTPCRGRRSRRGKLKALGLCVRRAVYTSSPTTRSRSGKSAAPASPAAARRRPCPPGATLAVRARPETRSRVDLAREQRARPPHELTLARERRRPLRLVEREPAHGVHLPIAVAEAPATAPH